MEQDPVGTGSRPPIGRTPDLSPRARGPSSSRRPKAPAARLRVRPDRGRRKVRIERGPAESSLRAPAAFLPPAWHPGRLARDGPHLPLRPRRTRPRGAAPSRGRVPGDLPPANRRRDPPGDRQPAWLPRAGAQGTRTPGAANHPWDPAGGETVRRQTFSGRPANTWGTSRPAAAPGPCAPALGQPPLPDRDPRTRGPDRVPAALPARTRRAFEAPLEGPTRSPGRPFEQASGRTPRAGFPARATGRSPWTGPEPPCGGRIGGAREPGPRRSRRGFPCRQQRGHGSVHALRASQGKQRGGGAFRDPGASWKGDLQIPASSASAP